MGIVSAEELREAAALMRSRAEKAAAQSGPEWTCRVQVAGYAWLEPAHIGLHGYQSTAEHIASWHPAVALAVADWLDAEARKREAIEGFDRAYGAEPDAGILAARANDIGPALAVARAYLGRTP